MTRRGASYRREIGEYRLLTLRNFFYDNMGETLNWVFPIDVSQFQVGRGHYDRPSTRTLEQLQALDKNRLSRREAEHAEMRENARKIGLL